jgi:hypothetical protein
VILEREDSQRGAVILAPYFGTDAFGTIVGTSSEPGVEILRYMLEGFHYQRALLSGSVALLDPAPVRYNRKESWAAFEALGGRTEDLLRLPESDELGRVRPSLNAVSRAKAALFAAFDSGGPLSSQADVCTDADGAIHILWEDGSRSLELVCPFDETDRAYVYFADERDHRLAFDLGKTRLRRLFSWLRGWKDGFPK